MQDQSLSPVVFCFESHDVRTIEVDGEPWFVARDVASVLGYAKPENAISMHCKAPLKQGIPSASGIQQTTIISERDLYRLIMRSSLPAAEKFEEWIVAEVIPSIRKHGHYSVAPVPVTDPMAILKLTFEALTQVSSRVEEVEQTINAVEQSVTALTDTMRLHHWQCHELKAAVSKRVFELNAERNISVKLLYPAIWGFVKRHFKVPVYTTIPAMRYDEAVGIVRDLQIEQLPDYVQNQAGQGGAV